MPVRAPRRAQLLLPSAVVSVTRTSLSPNRTYRIRYCSTPHPGHHDTFRSVAVTWYITTARASYSVGPGRTQSAKRTLVCWCRHWFVGLSTRTLDRTPRGSHGLPQVLVQVSLRSEPLELLARDMTLLSSASTRSAARSVCFLSCRMAASRDSSSSSTSTRHRLSGLCCI